MTNHTVLNNVDHLHHKVTTRQSAEFGDNQMVASLTISELRQAQRDMPIVFHIEESDGKIYPMAIMGFEHGENLFLTPLGWSDNYVPAVIAKGPFLIGRQELASGEEEWVISIDLDDPRVSTDQGEPLFNPHGGNSDYTNRIAEVLNQLASDRETTAAFGQTLRDLDLLEPLSLEFETVNGSGVRMSGFYVINEEKLAALDGDKLAKLAQQGFLHACYMAIASLSNLTKLVKLKQEKARLTQL